MASVESVGNRFFDLSANVKVQVVGQDHARYLNGQLTKNLNELESGQAMLSCLLSAKGKMEAFVVVSKQADGVFVDGVPELVDVLQGRLDKYIIADAVETRDRTGELSIFHLLGERNPLPPRGGTAISSRRFGVPGFDIWCAKADHDSVFAEIAGSIAFADQADAETLRIENGIPRWGRELGPDILPPEAGLDETAIDYDKGCYVGQEVISRMKMSGQRSKRLSGFVSLDDCAMETGMKLFAIGEREKDVGWITSAVRSRRLGKDIALGYVRRPFFPSGYKLEARDPEFSTRRGIRVEVVNLPFVSLST